MIKEIFEIFNLLSGIVDAVPKKRRQFFNDHIEPIFQNMIKIHKDYASTFNEFYILVRNRNLPCEGLIGAVKERRREYWHLRDLVKDLSANLHDIHNHKKSVLNLFDRKRKLKTNIKEFASSVHNYFLNSTRVEELDSISWYTDFINNLEKWPEIKLNPWERNQMSDWQPHVLETLEKVNDKLLPEAWQKISRAYTKLRKLCLWF